jgi:hypothetical protein
MACKKPEPNVVEKEMAKCAKYHVLICDKSPKLLSF